VKRDSLSGGSDEAVAYPDLFSGAQSAPVASSCMSAGRGPWFVAWCFGVCGAWRSALYGDGVPGDGGFFALSDFALVGEGLDGGREVRGAWSEV
jgi:hypothetical protein